MSIAPVGETKPSSAPKPEPFWWRLHEPSARMLTRQLMAFLTLGLFATAHLLELPDMAEALLPFVGLSFSFFFRSA